MLSQGGMRFVRLRIKYWRVLSVCHTGMVLRVFLIVMTVDERNSRTGVSWPRIYVMMTKGRIRERVRKGSIMESSRLKSMIEVRSTTLSRWIYTIGERWRGKG